MVLDREAHAGGAGALERATERLDRPPSLGLDRLGTPGQIGAVEARRHPQDRTAERRGTLDPPLNAVGGGRHRLAAMCSAQRIARREHPEAELLRAARERGELVGRPVAGVVERELYEGGARIACLRERLLEGQLAVLQA